MRVIDPSYQIILPYPDWETARLTYYQTIEQAGRTCYKSENRITPDSSKKFVRRIIRDGHDAMLEHAGLTIRFIVDRGVSHELVRHRLASFAQESTRYCNYSTDKFGKELTFIRPYFLMGCPEEVTKMWSDTMKQCEDAYMSMLLAGRTLQEARSVLPNSLKTEVVMTANMREWRHFFRLRVLGVTGNPHPEMVRVALPLLHELTDHMPELFDDI